jgi:undecaprenyl-diphosphatase
MTVALVLGLTRPAAARFSLLLSIPVIATAAVDWLHLAIGIAVSGVSAWACIHFSCG